MRQRLACLTSSNVISNGRRTENIQGMGDLEVTLGRTAKEQKEMTNKDSQ